jgi:hypothetical protein
MACRFMGKVAAENGLKWVYCEPLEEDQSSSSFLSPWAISSLDPVRPLQLFNFLAHPTTRPAGYDA